MASQVKSARRKTTLPSRSAKAGRPPEERVLAPRVRRRQKSAHTAFSKDTTIHQAPSGSRATWPASRPKFKKG
jgi:hypothetical protein